MSDIQKIHELWKIYDMICDATIGINELFSFKVLIIFTGTFISIVFNLFHAMMSLTELNGEDASFHTILLVLALHHCIMYLLIMLVPIAVCNGSKQIIKNFAILINQLMVHEWDVNLSAKLHHFSMYMIHRKPNYSASGLCVLDNSLLFTIIGAITTYIVILMQFSTINSNTNVLNFIVSDNTTRS
ncbi:putative gustatory receptor 28b [Arctopsyche grandis]|uniref:putative gustatory receptor 28b n=1 Tax=Arctopsyche grandis TaxID=121162 RepID=UPI00406D7F73